MWLKQSLQFNVLELIYTFSWAVFTKTETITLLWFLTKIHGQSSYKNVTHYSKPCQIIKKATGVHREGWGQLFYLPWQNLLITIVNQLDYINHPIIVCNSYSLYILFHNKPKLNVRNTHKMSRQINVQYLLLLSEFVHWSQPNSIWVHSTSSVQAKFHVQFCTSNSFFSCCHVQFSCTIVMYQILIVFPCAILYLKQCALIYLSDIFLVYHLY